MPASRSGPRGRPDHEFTLNLSQAHGGGGRARHLRRQHGRHARTPNRRRRPSGIGRGEGYKKQNLDGPRLKIGDVATGRCCPSSGVCANRSRARGSGCVFDWKDQYEALQVAEAQELKLREEYGQKKAKAVNYDLYVAQLKEVEQSFGALVKQLPNRSEIDALLTDVNQAGLGRGLQFELFRPAAQE